MFNKVHGHDVMRMMLEQDTSYTEESLEKAIIEKYGEKTRFFTCAAENLTAKELIEFLADKGKFVAKEDGFNTQESNICSNE